MFTFDKQENNEIIRTIKKTIKGWLVCCEEGSHKIMAHPTKKGSFPFPDHGSKEIGKGLASAILKQAGLK